MRPPGTLLKGGVLFFTVLAALAILSALLVSSLLKTHPDDVLYPIVSSRVVYDGWVTLFGKPICFKSFTTPVSVELMPGTFVRWLIHHWTGSVLEGHLLNALLVIAWGVYLSWFLVRVGKVELKYGIFRLSVFLILLSSIGILFAIYVVNRPETSMIMVISFFAILPFFSNYLSANNKLTGTKTFLFCIVTALLVNWLVTSHPKALFYVPMMLVAGAFCWRSSRALSATTLLSTVGFTISAIFYHIDKMKCEDPSYASIGYRHYVMPEFFSNRIDVWDLIAQNFRESYYYVMNILYHNVFGKLNEIRYMWVSPMVDTPATLTVSMIGWMFTILLLAYLLVAALVVARRVFRKDRNALAVFLICGALVSAVLLQSALQFTKWPYDSGFVWRILILTAVIAAPVMVASGRWKKFLSFAFVAVLFGGTISAALYAVQYAPLLVRTVNGKTEFVDLSRWPLGSVRDKTHVLEAAELCGITPDRSSERVIIDTTTYYPLKETYRPILLVHLPRHYRDKEGNRIDHGSVEAFFRYAHDVDSSGVVKHCTMLGERYKPYLKKKRDFCCISRETIEIYMQEHGLIESEMDDGDD